MLLRGEKPVTFLRHPSLCRTHTVPGTGHLNKVFHDIGSIPTFPSSPAKKTPKGGPKSGDGGRG